MEEHAGIQIGSFMDCFFSVAKYFSCLVMFMDRGRPLGFQNDPVMVMFLLIYAIVLCIVELRMPFHDRVFYDRDHEGRIVPRRVPRIPPEKVLDDEV